MNTTLAKPHRKRLQAVLEHASGDKRFKILEVHMKRYQFRHDSLLTARCIGARGGGRAFGNGSAIGSGVKA